MGLKESTTSSTTCHINPKPTICQKLSQAADYDSDNEIGLPSASHVTLTDSH